MRPQKLVKKQLRELTIGRGNSDTSGHDAGREMAAEMEKNVGLSKNVDRSNATRQNYDQRKKVRQKLGFIKKRKQKTKEKRQGGGSTGPWSIGQTV